MLHNPKIAPRQQQIAAPDDILHFDLRYVLGILNRRRIMIAAVAGTLVALTIAYCLLAPLNGMAYYTGTAQVLLDQQRAQIFRPDNSLTGDITFDNASVESQVATIQSENVLTAVVRDLKLIDDPEFNGSGSITLGSLIKQVTDPIMRLLGMAKPEPTEEQRVRAIADLIGNKRLKVQRIGLSYAIEINVDSWSADKAARIANAIASTYIGQQVKQKEAVLQRAREQLTGQLDQLRRQASDADRNVLEFKLKNNIVDVAGTLLSDQQLAEVSSQLSAARSAKAEYQARLDRIGAVSASDIPDASVTDALKNEVITRLRNQYLDNQQKEAEWASRYGQNHVAAVQLRNQMAEIRKSTAEEMRRIGEGYRSDLEIAKAREGAVEKQLRDLFQKTAESRDLQVTLRDLEANAQSKRSLHDSLLSKLNLATQQEAFATADARIISNATPPQDRSWPKNALFVAASLVLGLGLGGGLAFLREYFDNAVRSSAQLTELTGAQFVGVLPLLQPSALKPREGAVQPRIAIPENAKDRVLVTTDPLLSSVIDIPFSRYTEAMRGLRVAAQIASERGSQQVIGVASVQEGEGKSTVAANLARLIARAGESVLLIDGDLRNSSLTRGLAPAARIGLAQVLAGARIDETLWHDPLSTMKFIPASDGGERITNTNELLGSSAMISFIQAAKDVFGTIIIDLPPLGAAVDAKAAAHLLDAVVFVTEWGRTSVPAVQKTLAQHPEITRKIFAAALNKADMDKIDQYEESFPNVARNGGYYFES